MGVGHALRICQCSTAVITTTRALPVQVDGEPCLLAPGVIEINFKNKATMLTRIKGKNRDSVAKPLDLSDDEDEMRPLTTQPSADGSDDEVCTCFHRVARIHSTHLSTELG